MSRTDWPQFHALAILLLVPLAAGCAGTLTRIRGTPFDPDSIPEAYARSTAALMWPGATRAWQITPAGDLYNGEWQVRLVPSRGRLGRRARVIAFEERWRPVAHWTRARGRRALGLRGRRAARARPARLGPDRFDRRSRRSTPGARPRPAGSRSASAPAARRHSWPSTRRERRGRAALGDGRLAPTPCRAGARALRAARTRRVTWTLAPGGQPQRAPRPAHLPRDRRARSRAGRACPHERRVGEARRYWDARGRARRPRSASAIPRSSARSAPREVTLLSLRERRGPHWVPIGESLPVPRRLAAGRGARDPRARGSWATRARRAGCARASRAAVAAGRVPEPARTARRHRPGAVGVRAGAAAARARRFRRPLRRRRRARLALGRVAARSGPPVGLGVRRACCPTGIRATRELVRAQLVGQRRLGARGIPRRGAAAARPPAARRRPRRSNALARALSRRLPAGARAHAARRDVPPSWQGAGRDWGNLAVVHPMRRRCRAGDPRVRALARRVWAAAGGAGARDLRHARLRCSTTWRRPRHLGAARGRAGGGGQRARGHAALAHARAAARAELFSRSSREFGVNLPPHGTSAAALANLLRDALVFDDGDTLRLTLGARARWWNGARVQRAPTRWG